MKASREKRGGQEETSRMIHPKQQGKGGGTTAAMSTRMIKEGNENLSERRPQVAILQTNLAFANKGVGGAGGESIPRNQCRRKGESRAKREISTLPTHPTEHAENRTSGGVVGEGLGHQLETIVSFWGKKWR